MNQLQAITLSYLSKIFNRIAIDFIAQIVVGFSLIYCCISGTIYNRFETCILHKLLYCSQITYIQFIHIRKYKLKLRKNFCSNLQLIP